MDTRRALGCKWLARRQFCLIEMPCKQSDLMGNWKIKITASRPYLLPLMEVAVSNNLKSEEIPIFIQRPRNTKMADARVKINSVLSHYFTSHARMSPRLKQEIALQVLKYKKTTKIISQNLDSATVQRFVWDWTAEMSSNLVPHKKRNQIRHKPISNQKVLCQINDNVPQPGPRVAIAGRYKLLQHN